MKKILKPFRATETDEALALRRLLATPGFAQSVERIDHVDAEGTVMTTWWGAPTPPPQAVGELVTLTDEGSVEHDKILDLIQSGVGG